jgi:hypothetical protein
MKKQKTITGAEIEVTPNYSKRTFTIRKNGTKYRTFPMDKQEFNSCLHNSGQDWQNFLRSDDYYKVR